MPWWPWSAIWAMVSPAHLGQRSILEVGPQELDRIELGCVGRQPLDREPVAVGIQVGAHLVASMRAEPIPTTASLADRRKALRWSSTPIRLSVS
jgi:hypothetical protein